MIKAYIAGPKRVQVTYVIDICLKMIGHRYSLIESVFVMDPDDILLTNKPDLAVNRSIVIDENEVMSMFGKISLQEEIEKGSYDRFGRLSGKASRSAEPIPVVNQYAYSLKEKIDKYEAKKNYKKNETVVVLTHDVDRVDNRKIITVAGKLIYCLLSVLKLDFQAANKYFNSLCLSVAGINTYWDFEEYIKLETEHGVRSTFFFMADPKGFRGARYDIRKLAKMIREMADGGWEVGLHVNCYRSDDSEKIRNEKNILEEMSGSKVVGARFHYLKFNPRLSFDVLSESGFSYDSSLGFHDHVGYRCGLAFPFKAWNNSGNCERSIVEIPLIIMDHSLFEMMKLGPAAAWEYIKSMIESFKGRPAVITILWHHGVLRDPVFEGWREVYARLLDYLTENGITVRLARDICADIINTE